MDLSRDYYATLGVTPDATADEIKKIYRQLVRQYHPDAQVAPGTAMLFREIQAAYEVLGDPEQRARYDRARAEAAPAQRAPFVLHLQFSGNPLPALSEEQALYVLATIEAAQVNQRPQRPPLNLCLVIDRSTSMQGVRLERVKAATYQLIDMLDQGDMLSIVTFSDRAELVWSSRVENEQARARTRIASIQASGGTEILQGLQLGMTEMEKNRRPQSLNHMLLLTDGQTYGDEERCLSLAVEAKKHGISVSCMGLGDDWNDVLLDAIATRSGGLSAYIASPDDVQRLFQEHLHGINTTYSTDVQCLFRAAEGVTIRHAFRLTPYLVRLPIDKEDMALGTLQADNPLVFILELAVASRPVGPQRLAQIELSGSLASSVQMPARLRQDILLNFVSPSAISSPTVPPAILSSLAKVAIFQMQENAWRSLEKGNVAEASHRLEMMATRLLDLGERQLARATMLEAGRLARSGQLSASGRKTIKYGTRSLSLSSEEHHHD